VAGKLKKSCTSHCSSIGVGIVAYAPRTLQILIETYSAHRFEAKLEVGSLLKKLVEALNQLVTEANFDCSISGISLQAMDNAHCSLSSLLLSADGFTHYRCDRRLTLGINLASMTKLLKCCGNDDSVMLHCDGSGDTVTFVFESPSTFSLSILPLSWVACTLAWIRCAPSNIPS
jgi:DNA polymerase III sliding clamp (beta) subunit (PCNA family)